MGKHSAWIKRRDGVAALSKGLKYKPSKPLCETNLVLLCSSGIDRFAMGQIRKIRISAGAGQPLNNFTQSFCTLG